MEFEWDEVKNQINQKKHGISFEEAKAVYAHENDTPNNKNFSKKY